MLEIYIGPNGYGKTRKLISLKEDLIKKQNVDETNILFIDSEILLMDEVKDTKDNSKTMEYILTEILSTDSVTIARTAFEDAIDKEIIKAQSGLDCILDSILSINEQTREPNKNLVITTSKKEYKKLVKINSDDIKNKMGSGQRMQLILSIANQSNKNYIFIDEPEKYSHPSMLNKTASILQTLSKTKNVYIATHSPKLLSMLSFDFDNLYIINDSTHVAKVIPFEKITNDLKSKINIGSFNAKEKSYYDKDSLIKNIFELHYREFLEVLFSKTVYVCEGESDVLFIKKVLLTYDEYYNDYTIFLTHGKFIMPVFAEIFKFLNIDLKIYFDKDDETVTNHQKVNSYLKQFTYYSFDKNLEDELGYKSNKYDYMKFIEFIEIKKIAPKYHI